MLQALLPSLLPVVGDVLDRFFPDKEKAAEAQRAIEAALIQNAAQINLAQIEVNKAEAASRNVFVAGWRPFIGWACGMAFFWQFVGMPLTVFVLGILDKPVPELPVFDFGPLMTVMMGMLGLGGLRTYEKLKGVAK